MSIAGTHAGVVFLILLVFIIALALLARRVQVPYPVMLVVGGLALSLVPVVPNIELEPELIFYGVLPPLLYSAAWSTSWRDFSYHLVSIVSLAFGLVIFTIVGVALAAPLLLAGFDWRLGAVLGALVAPTDPLAAAAVASRLGLPRRIVDLIEGESLINDAVGLVAVELGVGIVVAGGGLALAPAAMRFLYVAAAGIGIGTVAAFLVDALERRIDDAPIEIAISLMVPYAVYLTADAARSSGVVAVVTCGLILGRRSPGFFSPAVRLQVYAFWNAVVFILNSLVFVLIGLQLRDILGRLSAFSTSSLLMAGALVSITVVALRLAWVVPGSRLSYAIRHRLLHQTDPTPGGRELAVVGWSGVRGVISLAAAFALPAATASGSPFPHRDLLVFLTFSVVVFTLVVQTVTLGPLIRALGLEGGTGLHCEERDARRLTLQAAIDHLEKARQDDRTEFGGIYDDLVQHYRHRLAAVSDADDRPPDVDQHERYQALARELLDVQRRTALRLLDEGRINDEVLRRIERDLDLETVHTERVPPDVDQAVDEGRGA